MKGVVDIEFILSVMVFLTTVTFVTFIIMSNTPLFHRESLNEDLRSRAYEMSELLIFDEGYPSDWGAPGVVVQRLGLSDGDMYVLSLEKINKFDSICQNQPGYQNVKALLGQDFRTDINIEITDSDNNNLVNCTPVVITTVRPKFQITRFAVLQNKKILKLVVGVS